MHWLLLLALLMTAPVHAAPRAGLADALTALDPATRWEIVERVPLAFDAHHPQGLVKLGDRFFLTSVQKRPWPLHGHGWIHEFSAAGKQVRTREIASGRIFHPGGLDFDGTSLWTAVSVYRSNSRAQVLRIDPATLDHRAQFDVPDHLGTVVRNVDCDTFLATSWGSKTFYTLDPKGAVLARRPNPSGALELQDCKYLDGNVMLGSGFKDDRAGLELFRLDTGTKLKFIPIRVKSDRGSPMTRNPVAAELVDGRVRLYCVPDDGRSTLYVLEPSRTRSPTSKHSSPNGR